MPDLEARQHTFAPMSVAEYVCSTLENNGIDTVFGIPGVHNVELYRGLASSTMRHITPRNEQGAGFMADGYARSSGKVAACFVITGPGLTNIATAMGQALADSVPMLVISSVNPIGDMGTGQGWLHEMPDQRAFAQQVAIFSHTILTAGELPTVLARAFAVFHSCRPGPVHIEIPVNLFPQEMPKTACHTGAFALPAKPCASLADMGKVFDVLNGAHRPVIIVGGGAVDAGTQVGWLAEAISAPVMMTSNARGILPPDHPLAVSCSPALEPVRKLLQNADVILALGTELGSSEYYFGNLEPIHFDGKLIRIDIDAQQLMRMPNTDIAILSDCREALKLLMDKDFNSPTNNARIVDDLRNLKEQINAQAPAHYKIGQSVLKYVAETLPNSTIVGDSTQPVYAGMMHFAAQRPRSWFCSATGFGTLGYAVSAATGAWLARGQAVVAVIGDGGLMFNLGEILTARQIGCPLIILLWNNRGYSEINTYMRQRNITPIGVDVFAPDFKQMAQSFECAYEILSGFDGLKDILIAAAKRSHPTLIELDEAGFLKYA